MWIEAAFLCSPRFVTGLENWPISGPIFLWRCRPFQGILLRRRPELGNESRLYAQRNQRTTDQFRLYPGAINRSAGLSCFSLWSCSWLLILVVVKNRQFWSDALGIEELVYKTTSDSIRKAEPHINNIAPSRKAVPRQITSSSGGTHSGIAAEASQRSSARCRLTSHIPAASTGRSWHAIPAFTLI